MNEYIFITQKEVPMRKLSQSVRRAIGQMLRSRRKFHHPKKTLQEFADLIGITGPYLTRIELGQVQLPSEQVLRKLASNLNLSYSSLLTLIQKIEDNNPTVLIFPSPFDNTPAWTLSLSQAMGFFGHLLLDLSSQIEQGKSYELDLSAPLSSILDTALISNEPMFREARQRAFRRLYEDESKLSPSDALEIEKKGEEDM